MSGLYLRASSYCWALIDLFGSSPTYVPCVAYFGLICLWNHMHVYILMVVVKIFAVVICSCVCNLIILTRIGASLQHHPRWIAWMARVLLRQLWGRGLHDWASIFDSTRIHRVDVGSLKAFSTKCMKVCEALVAGQVRRISLLVWYLNVWVYTENSFGALKVRTACDCLAYHYTSIFWTRSAPANVLGSALRIRCATSAFVMLLLSKSILLVRHTDLILAGWRASWVILCRLKSGLAIKNWDTLARDGSTSIHSSFRWCWGLCLDMVSSATICCLLATSTTLPTSHMMVNWRRRIFSLNWLRIIWCSTCRSCLIRVRHSSLVSHLTTCNLFTALHFDF